jgi:hypothetical protein
MDRNPKNQINDFVTAHKREVENIKNINLYKNPNARISKLYDEKVMQINTILTKKQKSLNFALIFKFPIMYLKMILIVVAATFFDTLRRTNFSLSLNKHKEALQQFNLVIGHATKRNILTIYKVDQQKNDELYKSMDNLYLYIDHSRKLAYFKQKKINLSENFVILPKTMGFKNLTIFLKETTGLYILLNKMAWRKDEKDLLPKKAISFLISGQLSYQTYSNYNLAKQIETIYESIQPHSVNFPIEGHAIEEYINYILNSELKVKNLMFHQISPLCQDQIGLREFISGKNLSDATVIKVGNAVSRKYLNELNPNLNMVSESVEKKKEIHICSVKKEFILLAPENFEYECMKFINLAKIIRLIDTEYKILFRHHPEYEFSKNFEKELNYLRLDSSFVFSDSSLEFDLCRAKSVIHAGSSVSIDALFHKTVPIYYENDFEFVTDPILNRYKFDLPILHKSFDNLNGVLNPDKEFDFNFILSDFCNYP